MEKWSFQRTRELMTPRALRGMAVNEIGRARISMMVRSMSSNSRPDTLVQDRTHQPHRFSCNARRVHTLGSSAFRLSAAAVSMSLTGSCFSSESAPRPFQRGIRRRGGTICSAVLPSDERQLQADRRTHLIHRPARDIIPPLGGARVSSYRMCSCMVFMLLRPVPWSSGTRCHQPRCGA
jgi:hypothetical protein